MLHFQEDFSCTPDYDWSLLGEPRRQLFFDIETTGLKAGRASLYLIGCVYCADGQWRLEQFFAEDMSAERAVLEGFLRLAGNFERLIGFNSDGFDLPFLRGICGQYGLDFSVLDRMKRLDLLKVLRPMKRFLQMDNMKLKSCERLIGIEREDMFSGGELISVYESYTQNPSREALECLCLHNAEDLKNLPCVLQLCQLPEILGGAFAFERAGLYLNCQPVSPDRISALLPESGEQTAAAEESGRSAPAQSEASDTELWVLELNFQSRYACPAHLCRELGPYTLSLQGRHIQLCVSLSTAELKHFFSDYKNYVYLPAEDCAVHRSIGDFIETSHRKKASAQTAYIRSRELFLPQPGPLFEPVFQPAYRDSRCFVPLRQFAFEQAGTAEPYLNAVFAMFSRHI